MRRLPILATAATLIAGVFLAISSAPSNADDPSYDVWGIRASDRVLNSNSCRYVTVTASTNINPDDLLSIDAEVWRGSENVGSVSLSHTSAGRLRGQYYHCPYEGVGTFRIGPSEVSVWSGDFDLTSHMDYSKGSFVAKQAARFTKVKASRKGKVVTVKANPQYYSIGWDSGWRAAKASEFQTSVRKSSHFRLQRRNANGTGAWRTVKGAKPPKSKTLVFKVKTKRKYQYRIVSNETTTTFAGTSRGVRR
ncbi:hypothetical protein [Aeromicrobium sp. 179-A 4D2 NHS]|uniref:hypothetical protein n=1 Tax=Aeromicrobium sp. 179-A 4D2 NHS TaxID=3142375 RepID=UPI0039A1CA91